MSVTRGLAPLDSVKAANAAPTSAARRYLKLSMTGLTSLLVGPGKKTGLLPAILWGIGHRFLSGVGAFQFFFLNRFQQTLLRTLVHEEIISQKKLIAAVARYGCFAESLDLISDACRREDFSQWLSSHGQRAPTARNVKAWANGPGQEWNVVKALKARNKEPETRDQ